MNAIEKMTNQLGICDRGKRGIPLHQGPHRQDHFCENWRAHQSLGLTAREIDRHMCFYCKHDVPVEMDHHVWGRAHRDSRLGDYQPCTARGWDILGVVASLLKIDLGTGD